MQSVFSHCGRFRYLLSDVWDTTRPTLAWCLFNPSIAGTRRGEHMATDPTWTKGMGFSKRLGYGGQVFCNLFAYVATDPKALKMAGYPVGPANDQHILQACRMGDGQVVCAWGALGRDLSRPAEVLGLLRAHGFRPMALGYTRDGLPRHPLRLGYGTLLVPMDPTAVP